MDGYQDDSWVWQESYSDSFDAFREDFILPGDDFLYQESPSEFLKEPDSSFMTPFKSTQVQSKPLKFIKNVRKRTANFSWSISGRFDTEEELLEFKKKAVTYCNKVILITASEPNEILGYLNLTFYLSKKAFHTFFPELEGSPANGGCNDNANLFLNYLNKHKESKLILCQGFNSDFLNIIKKY